MSPNEPWPRFPLIISSDTDHAVASTSRTKDLRHHNHPQAVSPPSSGTFVASESPRLISTSSNPPTSLRSGDGAPLPPSTTSYLPSSKPRPPLPTTPKPSLSPFQPTSSSIQRSISSPVSITHGSNLGQPSSPIPGRSMASLAISSRSPSAQSPKKPIFSPAPTPRCEGCGKSVFMAEQVVALDKKWHKSCLRCIVCGKGLAQGNALEHDNKPTCAPCYKKVCFIHCIYIYIYLHTILLRRGL